MREKGRLKLSKKFQNISLITLKVVKEKSIAYEDWKVTSPKKAYEILKSAVGNCDRENLGVLLLSCTKEVNAIEICSIGTLDASLVSPREVFKSAIITNSACIIIFHTHPSGNITPSIEDKMVTALLDKASQIIGIPIIDHIILGIDDFYSFKLNGYTFGRCD